MAETTDIGWAIRRVDLFKLISETPMLLTKRPQNISKMLPADWGNGYANVCSESAWRTRRPIACAGRSSPPSPPPCAAPTKKELKAPLSIVIDRHKGKGEEIGLLIDFSDASVAEEMVHAILMERHRAELH
jgi:hypothetical protein